MSVKYCNPGTKKKICFSQGLICTRHLRKKMTLQFGANAIVAIQILVAEWPEAILSPLGWASSLTRETASKSRIAVRKALSRMLAIEALQDGRAVHLIRVETGFEYINTKCEMLGLIKCNRKNAAQKHCKICSHFKKNILKSSLRYLRLQNLS